MPEWDLGFGKRRYVLYLCIVQGQDVNHTPMRIRPSGSGIYRKMRKKEKGRKTQKVRRQRENGRGGGKIKKE